MNSYCKLISMVCLASLVMQTAPASIAQDGQIKVEIIGAEPKGKEAEQVLDAFRELMQAIAHKEIDTIGGCLSPEVVVVDEHNHKLLFGKSEVLEHIRRQVLGTTALGELKKFTVYDPFIDVTGDTAMVSFKATKEYTGAKATKMVSWCSEIFERDKQSKEWKVLHFRSNWSPVHPAR